MSKTLVEVDLLKHATPVKRKRAPKEKKPEEKPEEKPTPVVTPEPVIAEPKAKKPRTEKQIAATERMKKAREEKKAAAALEAEKLVLEEALKKKELEEKKLAAAEKRRLAREEKKKENIQTPEVSSVPILEKPKKEKKEKALVIENVIKEVVKPEPKPVEVAEKAERESARPPMTEKDRRMFDSWMKKGQSIFGYSYVNGSNRRML